MSSFWNLFGTKPGDPTHGHGTEGGDQQPPQIPPGMTPEQLAAAGPPPQHPHPQPHVPGVESKGPPPPAPKVPSPHYGIDDAIKLMRTLPVDENVDLVVRVIKRTLESLAVRVPEIIDDAARRQDALRATVGEHQAAIVQLEREIEARRQEIGRLEEALAETTTVRERLQLAEATPTVPSTLPKPLVVSPPSSGKKVDLPQGLGGAQPQRSAPPLPPTFKPKLGAAADAAKKAEAMTSPVPITTGAMVPPPSPASGLPTLDDESDEEATVESRDMIEKIDKT